MSGDFGNREGANSANNDRVSEDALDRPLSFEAVSPPIPPAAPTAPAAVIADNSVSDRRTEAMEAILSSEIGINTLLIRLKQSIASARDFAAFLKKRSSLEEEQATGLKRLSRTNLESLRKSDVKAGSYAGQVAELMHCHERIADHGMQFALSLHQMHEDLTELSANMERGRKQWKHEGLDAEKRASDAEAAMQKAKARYDSLAEDYDRARTGDTKGSRRLGLKGPKSAEQYESELLRKVQAADTDYEEKVRVAKAQRESLLREGRPRAVQALRELCQECDSGLALQLQKFATFNEKLLLGNGLDIAPLPDKENPGGAKSLRDTVSSIDNDKDLCDFVMSHSLPPRPTEIRYEKHPTLAPKVQVPTNPSASFNSSANIYSPQTPSQSNSMGGRFGSQSIPGLVVAPSQPPTYGSPTVQQHSFQSSPQPSASYTQSPSMPLQSHPPIHQNVEHDAFAAPPYPVHPSERQQYATPAMGQVHTSGMSPAMAAQPFSSQTPVMQDAPRFGPSSSKAVFGVSLDELFARDSSAVPVVVIHCILAVDTFGLDVEGIYRISGTTSQVNQLRDRFNANPSGFDLHNPSSFSHDINSVAQLLKQFFRELPDPLFTHAAYDAFIQAAKADDDIARRDGLHQLINDLPDPNYATLRALVLHLYRVMQHESSNRMGSSNLALCFAPSIMGQHTGAQIADASLQARVVDTILQNATAIFDED